jgi:hypothetical protein
MKNLMILNESLNRKNQKRSETEYILESFLF